jgi:hypothetical protein
MPCATSAASPARARYDDHSAGVGHHDVPGHHVRGADRYRLVHGKHLYTVLARAQETAAAWPATATTPAVARAVETFREGARAGSLDRGEGCTSRP